MPQGGGSLIQSILSLFSFYGKSGPQLIDASDLTQQASLLFSAQGPVGVIALAGGGQVGATPLKNNFNRVDTCANNDDSVALPFAIPGASVYVDNNTAQTLAVYGQANPSNPSAAGAAQIDRIVPHASVTLEPAATGATQATGVAAQYVCTQLGQWKQILSA